MLDYTISNKGGEPFRAEWDQGQVQLFHCSVEDISDLDRLSDSKVISGKSS